MYSVLSGIGVYEYFEDTLTVTDGELPTDFNEVVISSTIGVSHNIFTFVDNQKTYSASGIISYNDGETGPELLMKLEDLRRYVYEMNYSVRGSDLFVNSNDVKETNDFFKLEGIESESLYDSLKEEYFDAIKLESTGIIMFSLIVLGASSLSYYFIIRSSLISRIYEISVYRALGVSKMDIRKIFVTEIVLKTSISSAVGFLATSWFLMRIQSMAADYYEFIYFNFWNVILGLGVIYGINILAGLIPVSDLLRKTPAEILSKYDL